MFSRIRSAVCSGIEGREVFVETDVARGLPGIYIVGLASTMIMESRERIKSAIQNSDYDYPHGRITVNLTPASLRKNGSCLDLPIAVGLLTANLFIDPGRTEGYGIIGELALDGRVLGVNGVLPMIINMQKAGIRKAIVPYTNRNEAVLVKGIEICSVRDLKECVEFINGNIVRVPERYERNLREANISSEQGEYVRDGSGPSGSAGEDYADICGQETAKRAITIAVTGRHGLLMVGSPGCGKTMLSKRIPTIMPPMNEEEMIETAVIYSASGKTGPGISITARRPFRNPHHTIGRAGLIGGGMYPVPGEISLAHNGVLFLDEICEFDKDNIEALRIPLEEKKITHFRMSENYTFPSDFQLVLASNPCPCGYYGDRERQCKCTEAQIEKYRRKLSGPIMDRIDMRIEMERVTYDELRQGRSNTTSAEMKSLVLRGTEFARQSGRMKYNSALSEQETELFCALGDEEERFMQMAYNALKMSPRSYKRTLRVARTIADLDLSETIQRKHLAEALSFRITEASG